MRTENRTHSAFSLLELMLVIAIMGVLMAVVAFNVVGQGNQAKVSATKASMKTIKNALDGYYLNHSAYPPALETLVQSGVLQSGIADGWKRPFIYMSPGRDQTRPYELLSKGADDQTGSPDDIDVWTMDKQ